MDTVQAVSISDRGITEGGFVSSQYNNLATVRDAFLKRAREASRITIPTLIPESGATYNTEYHTPYQSIGARGVNNLASKMLMALLPPNSPFFRLTIDDFDLANLIGEDQRGAVEEGLARIERAALAEIESEAMRVPIFEALKHLIVGGNALLHLPTKGGMMRVFHLNSYVTRRDPSGNILKIIVKENLNGKTLPEELQKYINVPDSETPAKNYELYTCIHRTPKRYEIYQEIQGNRIEESYGQYPLDQLPWIPLRFNRIDNEDYGRGFVEEYIGDLKSVEALSQAVVEGSAAAAKVLFLVKPNGTTKLRTLADSPNGAIVQGDANDVSTLQLQKSTDFRVANEMLQYLTNRLQIAFLMNSSVERQAERVTAEEIRYKAQELEMALGGVYSVLSQELQVPLVKQLLNRLTKQGKMPKFPKNSVKPEIVTGIEALGRGQDLNKLNTFLQYLQPLGQDVIAREMNVGDYIDRLGASLGIDTGGLIKSPEQKAMEQQQAEQQRQQMMQQEMMKNVVEGSAPAVTKEMVAGMGNMDPEQLQESMQQMQQQMPQ
ncbi:portal protein [Acinetobacter sp.]|uniref:portal protein n=1 Tax=Acinetobacter sp. TaxID=472 RepID=UPI000C0B50A5|nr:portal protein [Acinetobacter sp.]MAK30451.1 phage tail protein [Acinetobacter sp.]|tara:strand:+ start:12126 stop:13772 length:1647 start_codon:yes stop_codon:yes gene_type:complete